VQNFHKAKDPAAFA